MESRSLPTGKKRLAYRFMMIGDEDGGSLMQIRVNVAVKLPTENREIGGCLPQLNHSCLSSLG